VPREKVASDETFVARWDRFYSGNSGIIFAAIVVVCVLGGLAGFGHLSPASVLPWPKTACSCRSRALHTKYGTQRAIAIRELSESACPVSSFQQIISYSSSCRLFVGSQPQVVRNARKSRDLGTAALTPGYPVTPIVS